MRTPFGHSSAMPVQKNYLAARQTTESPGFIVARQA
jgi:hypothetical protein